MKSIFVFFVLSFFFVGNAGAQNATTPATTTAVQDPAPVVYSNTLTQLSFPLPEGFKLSTATDTSVFIMGPTVLGRMMSINMNLTPVPQGVKEEQMYTINLDSYKKNTAQYTNLQELSLPKGKGFLVEEKAKMDPEELHRRFMMLWVNGYQVNLMMAGSFAGLAEKKDLVDAFFKSVNIPAAVN